MSAAKNEHYGNENIVIEVRDHLFNAKDLFQKKSDTVDGLGKKEIFHKEMFNYCLF